MSTARATSRARVRRSPTDRSLVHRAVSATFGSWTSGILTEFVLPAPALRRLPRRGQAHGGGEEGLEGQAVHPEGIRAGRRGRTRGRGTRRGRPPRRRGQRGHLSVLGGDVGRRGQRVGGQTAQAVGRGERQVAGRKLPHAAAGGLAGPGREREQVGVVGGGRPPAARWWGWRRTPPGCRVRRRTGARPELFVRDGPGAGGGIGLQQVGGRLQRGVVRRYERAGRCLQRSGLQVVAFVVSQRSEPSMK